MGHRFRRSFGVRAGSYSSKFARRGGRGDTGIHLLLMVGSIAVVGAAVCVLGKMFIWRGSGG